MAQQVFPQWSPVVKAHNEDQQEVYIPAAIIHAQTRDGKDELIVGAANMQFDPETGDYLPTHAGNPVEVRARALETLLQTLGKEETLALVKAALDVLVSKDFATQTTLAAVLEKLADLATESTLAQSVDKLNSILSRLEGKLDTAIFDSQGNPISAANRLPVEATLSGSDEVLPVNPMVPSVRADRGLIPCPAYFDIEWIDLNPKNVNLRSMDKSGVLYGTRFREVVKSEDEGNTWTQVWVPPTTGEYPAFILPMDNGELVVTTWYPSGNYNGHVYVSSGGQTAFTKVLDTPRAIQGIRYGQHVYRNFVLLTEYGTKIEGVDSARRAYLSRDYGQTFTKIFEVEDHPQVHTHHIQFDPYAGRIWITLGDVAPQQNVYYSDDWGKNWFTLWEPGEAPINPLSIACLPDCVLIGSDQAGDPSIWRYDRRTGKIDQAWSIPNGIPNSTFVSGSAYYSHLDSGEVVAYIPFHAGGRGTSEALSLIVATSDGLSYRTMWRSPETNNSQFDFQAFAGETEETIWAYTSGKWIMKIAKPEWK